VRTLIFGVLNSKELVKERNPIKKEKKGGGRK